MAIQMAEALSGHLAAKVKRIYSEELIVGNFSSRRVGGSIYPELHGIVVLTDLLFTPWRLINRLELSGRNKLSLVAILPFWTFRFLGMRAYSGLGDTVRFLVEQMAGSWYLINESGGVAHVAPDYEKLIRGGLKDEWWRAVMRRVPKYGNDDAGADLSSAMQDEIIARAAYASGAPACTL